MRRKCPHWFQSALTRLGGKNPFGQPRYKLVWGESETMRDGGYFVRDGYEGYRDVPALGGEACWALMMWEPSYKFGTPSRWYREHKDEATGLITLGQFPYRGRYRQVIKLRHRELVNGKWQVWRMEPTHFILDAMVPMLMARNRLSAVEKMEVEREERRRKEQEADRMLDDSLDAMRISRSSPLVQKRMEQMERYMANAMRIASHTQRGLHQASI